MAHKIARRILAPLKHFWMVFVAETKRLAAYRAQFWFELILSSTMELFIALAVWQTVFLSNSGSAINGYTVNSMTLYLTVAIFFGQASKGTGVGTFQREVYQGTLTKYLIYPLSVYSYKFGTFLPRSFFSLAQMTLALVIVWVCGYWPVGAGLTLAWMVAGLLSLFLSCLLYFFLVICIESLSFWVDTVWALSYALQISIVFLSGKAIPIDLFPPWAQHILSFSPFPYLAFFPTQAFLGQLPLEAFLRGISILVTWIFIAYLTSKIIMQRGLYQYTGVGQ